MFLIYNETNILNYVLNKKKINTDENIKKFKRVIFGIFHFSILT